MPIINMTPHPIAIHRSKLPPIEVAPSGYLVRVSEETKLVDEEEGIPFYVSEMGQPQITKDGEPCELPEMHDEFFLVVSALAHSALARHGFLDGRYDVYRPGEPVRDESGKIIGCHGLKC